jgi:hypothetical protein
MTMKKTHKQKSPFPLLRDGNYEVKMRDIPKTGDKIEQKVRFRKDMTRAIRSLAELTGLNREDLAARIAAAEDELLIPHARRGEKTLRAASQGGREAARQYHEPTREQYRAALVEHRRKYPNLSLSRARARIAARFRVCRRTVERHTKDLRTK